jgi:type IV pilus assembly protein PilB
LSAEQLAYAERVHARLGVERPLIELLREIYSIGDAQVHAALRIAKQPPLLGQLLVELGYLRPEFLEFALSIQQNELLRRERIGQVLLEHQLIEESKLVEALALHLGFPLEMPGSEPIDAELFEAIAIEECEKYCMVPLRATANGIVVAFSDPTDPEGMAAAERAFGADCVAPAIAERAAIRHALARAAGREGSADAGAAPPPAIVDLLSELLEEALEAGASALHFDPRADGIAVRQRSGGILAVQRVLPLSLAPALAHHLRFLCRTYAPSGDGRFLHHHGDRGVVVSVARAALPDGDRVVLRFADAAGSRRLLDELGLAASTLARLRSAMAERPGGLWLVAGPPGSGRSTTFHSLLDAQAGPEVAIATLESVAAPRCDGIIRLGFDSDARAAALFETAVAQDPDLLGIDEVRGPESARLALAAAAAGRLVFAVTAGSDATAAVVAFASLGVDRALLSATLAGVLAQRTLRRNCSSCAQQDRSRAARQLEDALGAPAGAFRVAIGCSECAGTGFGGTFLAAELWIPDASQQLVLARGGTPADLRRRPEPGAPATLFEDAVAHAVRGALAPGELVRAFGHRAEARAFDAIAGAAGR